MYMYVCMYIYIYIYICIHVSADGKPTAALALLGGGPRFASPRSATRAAPILGFSNGTLERRYSRIMLSPPQNMKPFSETDHLDSDPI